MAVDIIVGSPRVGEPPQAPADGAFRETASGLIVPAELSRDREVWTRDEWRALEKVTKLTGGRDLSIFLRCERPACRKHPIERLRLPDGSMVLRCAHKDRVFRRDL